MEKAFAVITGASNGLGKAFAYELAARKINLVLISLPGEGLKGLSEELRQYGIDTAYYETDLTDRNHVEVMSEWINRHFEVFMLINNAGIGGTKKFTEAGPEYLNRIIQLNVMTPPLLISLLLPNLMRQEKGYILNVSSMAAFSPMGYKTVYPASKAFVHHFTRGLYEELKHTNVFVSVVNPGPMKTNSDNTRRIERHGIFGKLGLLTPETVARRSVKRLFKRDTMIMLSAGNGINWLMMRLIPVWLRLPLLTRAIRKEIESEGQLSL
jgi:short-subunit dehydrogenase